jgi:hypothetical protein
VMYGISVKSTFLSPSAVKVKHFVIFAG